MTIEQEGKFKKLVGDVLQISYNGELAKQRNQNMWYVTERCVFRLTQEGMMLVEVAKGIDIERDILAQMEFRPLIAADLKITDPCIYRDGAFGLREYLLKK